MNFRTKKLKDGAIRITCEGRRVAMLKAGHPKAGELNRICAAIEQIDLGDGS